MNIFVTNRCPIKAAQEHCFRHNVKMIVELAQMLSTAHFELDGVVVGYKPTHKNHPCSVWIRETSGNYEWAYMHFGALCEEYTYRTKKFHKSIELLLDLDALPKNIKRGGLTEFAMAIPDKHKRLGVFDVTKAYQSYLNEKFAEWLSRDKPLSVEWRNREKPEWVTV